MRPDDRKPSPRTRKRIGIIVVAFVALTIALIFVGENITHLKMHSEERAAAANANG